MKHIISSLIIISLLGLLAPTGAQLPPRHPIDGELLAQTTLEGGYILGVYGPRPAAPGEKSLLTCVVVGTDTATFASGFVILAVPHGAVSILETPMPSGSYIPPGQWSQQESEWRQLMPLSPQSFWLTHLTTLAPPSFIGQAGTLLDQITFAPGLPQPEPDSVLHNIVDYDRVGAAFTLLETAGTPSEEQEQVREGHGVRITIPLLIQEPVTQVSFLVLITSAQQHHMMELPVSLSAAVGPTRIRLPGPGLPELTAPDENTPVGSPLLVTGSTEPGMMVTAWLELRVGDAQGQLLNDPPQLIRRLADERGQFEIPLTLPTAESLQPIGIIKPDARSEAISSDLPPETADTAETIPEETLEPEIPVETVPGDITTQSASSGELQYYLHVRTEAPGYVSPEIVRQLAAPLPAPELEPEPPVVEEQPVIEPEA